MSTKPRSRKRVSVAVFPLHMGGTNATRLELEAIFTPPYNAAGYGIRLTSSPRQADVVLLTGSLTAKMIGPVFELLASLPDEVKLVLLGSDASSAAPFASAYASPGPLLPSSEPLNPTEPPRPDRLELPAGKQIAAYVAGSPPDPQVILNAILQVASYSKS